MNITVCRFPDTERGPISPRLPYWLHLHVETCLLGTGHVKGGVAISFVALNASTRTTLFANVAGKLPACRWDVFDAVYGLQKDCVGKAYLQESHKNVRRSLLILFCLIYPLYNFNYNI